MPNRVRAATLLALCFHGILILLARYRFSYDAYTHMLFADHYRLNWWSLWDPRWYAGFAVTSYPPLVHQVIGLLGHLIGVDAAFGVVLWAVLSAYPIAVYSFSHIFLGRSTAGHAALGAAFLPSLYLAAYTFGQIPTLAGTLFALFCAASLAEFLRTGSRISGALSVMLIAVVTAAHHATLLFLPWIFFAVALHAWITRQVGWQKLLLRLALIGFFGAVAGLLVIWPFWRWGIGQAMQTPIDHPTRHNYLQDGFAAFLFFWSAYGPLVAVLPIALIKGFNRRFAGISVAFFILFLLGLGGTTPLPRWLFGSGWEWLTYDRFAFWATLMLLPFFGFAVALAQRKLRPLLVQAFRLTLPARFRSLRYGLIAVPLTLFAGAALLVSLYPTLLPTQPKPVNMQPVVDFLDQSERTASVGMGDGAAQWRYLTFGFGDQFAYLNRLTNATTIDGSYHTARTLPELRASGIGSIDSAYWLPGGLAALDPILQNAGKYGVRWGFVNNPIYTPVLIRDGWIEQATLKNGVEVWENPKAILPRPASQPASPTTENLLESFSWGTLPLLALAVTAGLAGLRLYPRTALNILSKVQSAAVGLLPVGLVFWYFHSLTAVNIPRVYFTYDNSLFYLSDGLAVVTVLAWVMVRWFYPDGTVQASFQKKMLSRQWLNRWWGQSIAGWLFALCVIVSLSILWARDRPVALYISLHLWLVFGLFLSVRDRPQLWKPVAVGFCVALAIQFVFGLLEFTIQSTQLLSPLKVLWPGVLDPSVRGASVVQLVDGTRWLRAYGTLPHPNILGTFVIALLAGPVTLFMTGRKASPWAVLLVAAGLALLVLSFSRGAWVGLFANILVILIKFRRLDSHRLNSRRLNSRRLLAMGVAAVIGLGAAFFPLRNLIFTRVAETSTVPTEVFSLRGRAWLAGQALWVIRQHPALGIGAGGFVLDLARRASFGYIVEPVHSLPLLVVSELGAGGAIILIGLCVVMVRKIWQARGPRAILLSAALAGLCVTSLFDHSLWSLAPGRVLLGLMLGLWAGQVENDESWNGRDGR